MASRRPRYFADETLANVGVPSTAQGITRDVSGQFFIGPDGLDSETPSTIVVGLESLQSDESRRDQRVREALEVGQHPDATFTATSIEGWPGEIPDGGGVEARLTGMLELSGVEREVIWDVEASRQGDVISALATTNFLYEDFDIPVLNIGGFVSVEEDVTLQIQLIAQADGT
ncbi:MAG: YceI family protein [Dehalococcoidia bacterium]|nr:YceI family protein [Dehalococcoidia bacterium]